MPFKLFGGTILSSTEPDNDDLIAFGKEFTPGSKNLTWLRLKTLIGGAVNFLGLADTPASYGGGAGKMLAVNSAENAIEFIAVPTSVKTVGTGGDYATHALAYAEGVREVVQISNVTETTNISATDDYSIIGNNYILNTSFVLSNSTTNKITIKNLTINTARNSATTYFLKTGNLIADDFILNINSISTSLILSLSSANIVNSEINNNAGTGIVIMNSFNNVTIDNTTIKLNDYGNTVSPQILFGGINFLNKITFTGDLSSSEQSFPAMRSNSSALYISNSKEEITSGRLSLILNNNNCEIDRFENDLFICSYLPSLVTNSNRIILEPLSSNSLTCNLVNSNIYYWPVGTVTGKTLKCIDSDVLVYFTITAGTVNLVLEMIRGRLYGGGLTDANFNFNSIRLDSVHVDVSSFTRIKTYGTVKDCLFDGNLTLIDDYCTVRGNNFYAGTITVNSSADKTILTENRTLTAIVDNGTNTVNSNNITY